jgi:hypothetical protein
MWVGGLSREQWIARGKAIDESGKYTKPRGEYLGTITAWGLPVYEGSPQEWKDALLAEVTHAAE